MSAPIYKATLETKIYRATVQIAGAGTAGLEFPVERRFKVEIKQERVAGPRGASAYEIALANGFIGSEAEWLASLGSSSAAYVHTQTTESVEWIVNHNLGVKPVVEILTTGGALVDAEVLHVTNNQLRIYFATLFTGEARCI